MKAPTIIAGDTTAWESNSFLRDLAATHNPALAGATFATPAAPILAETYQLARTIDAVGIKWLRFRERSVIASSNHFDNWFVQLDVTKREGAGMSVQGRQAEGHDLRVALGQLHADVVRNKYCRTDH